MAGSVFKKLLINPLEIMMTAKIQALTLAKYKLSTVCQDSIVQKEYPEVAEHALATLQDIERKIISLGPEENIILNENKYESAGDRV